MPGDPGERRRAVEIAPDFLDDLRHLAATNPRLVVRLTELMTAACRDPFRGIGKPEPLRHVGPDHWSRRLTDEHRLVYRVERDRITFLRARGHYGR